MKQTFYILLFVLASISIGVGQAAFMHSERQTAHGHQPEAKEASVAAKSVATEGDSLPKVKKTTLVTLADTTHGIVDLRDPNNLKTEGEFDDLARVSKTNDATIYCQLLSR